MPGTVGIPIKVESSHQEPPVGAIAEQAVSQQQTPVAEMNPVVVPDNVTAKPVMVEQPMVKPEAPVAVASEPAAPAVVEPSGPAISAPEATSVPEKPKNEIASKIENIVDRLNASGVRFKFNYDPDSNSVAIMQVVDGRPSNASLSIGELMTLIQGDADARERQELAQIVEQVTGESPVAEAEKSTEQPLPEKEQRAVIVSETVKKAMSQTEKIFATQMKSWKTESQVVVGSSLSNGGTIETFQTVQSAVKEGEQAGSAEISAAKESISALDKDAVAKIEQLGVSEFDKEPIQERLESLMTRGIESAGWLIIVLKQLENGGQK